MLCCDALLLFLKLNGATLSTLRPSKHYISNIHLPPCSLAADLFTYYGYKFEQLCTGGASANGGVVDASSEFALLVQLRLGSHDIVMAAEVDCARDVGPLSALPYDTSCFLELKTAK